MKHGRGAYAKGCRCDECGIAQREYMRDYLRSKSTFVAVVRTCQRCSAEFTVERHGSWTKKRFCSRKCQNAAANGTGVGVDAKALRRRARASRAKATKGTSSSWAWVQGSCHECGDYFVRHGAPSPYCSNACSRKVRNRARRALKAGVEITPIQRFRVHERDNWTCHICGDPVNRDAKVPELDAPTLDHVVALAAGGAHDESNLKTAHFYCNSVKRELPLSEVA